MFSTIIPKQKIVDREVLFSHRSSVSKDRVKSNRRVKEVRCILKKHFIINLYSNG